MYGLDSRKEQQNYKSGMANWAARGNINHSEGLLSNDL